MEVVVWEVKLNGLKKFIPIQDTKSKSYKILKLEDNLNLIHKKLKEYTNSFHPYESLVGVIINSIHIE
jgi:hypothetical protein